MKRSRMIDVYTDGSCCPKTKRYSYGCVMINNGKVIYKLRGVGKRPDKISSRNVSGELLGAMQAISWAIENGYKLITLHYDYIGVEKWATGEWNANLVVSKEYVEFIRKVSNKIIIRFVHVKGHSNDKYNDMADKLAKKALGLC